MTIEFKRVSNPQKVADYLSDKISEHLSQSHKVLWLVAGGSAMDVAIQTALKLKKVSNLSNLTISLTDERYGPVDHPGSNWRQLQQKGFRLPGARLVPVLFGDSLPKTAANYKRLLNHELSEADYSVALAGMGPDGHIFGIKPGSPAVQTDQEVIGYEWDDYMRLTPTIKLIERLDAVIIYAVGAEKRSQIDKLVGETPAAEQPAQLLKRLKKVIFFNDQRGDEI